LSVRRLSYIRQNRPHNSECKDLSQRTHTHTEKEHTHTHREKEHTHREMEIEQRKREKGCVPCNTLLLSSSCVIHTPSHYTSYTITQRLVFMLNLCARYTAAFLARLCVCLITYKRHAPAPRSHHDLLKEICFVLILLSLCSTTS
jgi:hypothetical protein